jgi:WD40 repeat protein
VLLPHRDVVFSITFSGDAEVVTSSADGHLRWWDWRGKPRVRLDVKAPASMSTVWTADGLIATAEGDRAVLRGADGKIREQINHEGGVVWVFSANEGLIGTAGIDGMFRLWQRAPGKTATEVARLRIEANRETPKAIVLSPDGRSLVTVTRDLERHALSPDELLALACARLASVAGADPEYARVCR